MAKKEVKVETTVTQLDGYLHEIEIMLMPGQRVYVKHLIQGGVVKQTVETDMGGNNG